MQIATLKPAAFTLSMLALAACGDPGPRTHDSQGRAVATAAMATTVFMNVCFKTGTNRASVIRAINKDKSIALTGDSTDTFLSASHKTHSIDMTLLSGICAVSFDNGELSETAASKAAMLLLPKVGAKSIGGSRGGGQINLKTRKGMVVIANGAKVHSNGAILTLFAN
ncbi:hypothetical protein [Profundibacter sp.]|uniref:hypothetical protein n=1 Tax=Profundibacter sp. TaxID=3101071 RepID=UPI003D146862